MDAGTPPSLTLWLMVPLLFLVFGGGLFFGIQHFLAWASGWKKLAVAYPASGEPPGVPINWRSARIGGLSYNNCIHVIAGREGLHLRMSFFLSFGHGPLFLPWRDLAVFRHKGWVFDYLVFAPARTPEVQLRMYRPQAEQILQAAGRALPPPA